MDRSSSQERSLKSDVLSAAAVTAGGILALALALASFQLILAFLELIVPGADADEDDWLRLAAFIGYIVLLGIVTWTALGSSLTDHAKAAVTFVPYGVFYTVLAGNLNAGLVPALLIGSLFFASVLAWLRYSGKPWIYVYALLLVSLAMIIITLTS